MFASCQPCSEPLYSSLSGTCIKFKPRVLPQEPPAHVPPFLPAFPDKHTYMATPAFAGNAKDARKQRLDASKARRQVWLLRRAQTKCCCVGFATVDCSSGILAPPA